ncbi:MAG: type IX secretion system sortase PorU, partial [Bacteroidia bacterium]|nr:type IX secretion system sortase PorU [Bacteroidia bacterium]
MTVRFLFTFTLLVVFMTNGIAQFKNQSVLAEGEIYKLAVSKTGIYKLDYNYFDQVLELDPSGIDPRNIHIYSNNGGFVPQLNNSDRIDDLNELAISVFGEDDGSFDPQDYILLYAEGADRYHFGENKLEFEKNIYDLKNYLFIKVDDSFGKRIQSQDKVNAEYYSSDKETIIRHENEVYNLLGSFSGTQGSGKQWFGEAFANNLTQDFSQYFSFPDFIPGSISEVEAIVAARSSSSSKFELSIDGKSFQTSHTGTNTGDVESLYAKSRRLEQEITMNTGNPSVIIEYQPVASNSEAWLDYIQIIAREKISYTGDEYLVFDRNSMDYNSYGFQFSLSEQAQIWDVTDVRNISMIEFEQQGGNEVQFGYNTDGILKAFMIFNSQTVLPAPELVGKVSNQNIHSIENADFVIVYHPLFEEAAEKLAQHRKSNDGLEVKTVDVFEIFNEFGGGKADPSAIRDFARMIYQRDENFRYLLLMGDATYDFRGIVPDIEYQNFVPTYQTKESLNPIEAFPSDDFFALLSSNEGDESLNGALDIGVGRIPCASSQEALDVVNKIIHYDTSPSSLGDWRLRIGFAADDQDISADRAHIAQSNEIAELTEGNHPEFIQQKVFFDAFNQVSTPGGQRYPDANAALNNNILNGQLVLGYLGHGGPKGWAQERVLQIGDILKWNNIDRLPVFITATCSFTGFDEPTFVSAGEHALLNPAGGAIALFTTVRAVFSSSNRRLTEEVYKKIFTRDDGKRLRFGDIIKESQNANSLDTLKSNSRKFMLIGDPSLTIASPKHLVRLKKLNGEEIDDNSLDTLGALEKATIEGEITDYDGNIINTFNGEIELTVYDKKNKRKTLDNDGQGFNYEYELRNSVLYKGSATVQEGKFEMDFILPKDINFEYGEGLLSFYASDKVSEDAGGYYDKIVIGGISPNAIADNEGPQINIFFDDRSFEYGGTTGINPLLILDLEDENGINLSSTSIGHDITATL